MSRSFASPVRKWGTVDAVGSVHADIIGLSGLARIGDELHIQTGTGCVEAEVVRVDADVTVALLFSDPSAIQVGNRANLLGPPEVVPSEHWLGRILDANGNAPDDYKAPPAATGEPRRLISPPPPAQMRRLLGPRLKTGLMAFDTLLPVRQGQRLGIFAGSGVGKSTLLGQLASGIDADRVVLGLIGERSREVREFAENVLSPEVRKKTVIIAATANQAPGLKKRAAYCAMTTAEYFCDQGHRVLLIIDSLTRFAEAHRETALLAGEPPALNAFPASTVRVISELVERAGAGTQNRGDMTALFSVLVAGSDFEEPLADMVRGILDGHIVLSRAIAERGRYPAIDVGKSVSRALPAAATDHQNRLIEEFRRLLAKYESLELLLRANMYKSGQDAEGDRAISLHGALDRFIGETNAGTIDSAFERLESILSHKPAAASAEPAEQ